MENASVLCAKSLLGVCAHLLGGEGLAPPIVAVAAPQPVYKDLADVKGQRQAKRALEVAAAGFDAAHWKQRPLRAPRARPNSRRASSSSRR